MPLLKLNDWHLYSKFLHLVRLFIRLMNKSLNYLNNKMAYQLNENNFTILLIGYNKANPLILQDVNIKYRI